MNERLATLPDLVTGIVQNVLAGAVLIYLKYLLESRRLKNKTRDDERFQAIAIFSVVGILGLLSVIGLSRRLPRST